MTHQIDWHVPRAAYGEVAQALSQRKKPKPGEIAALADALSITGSAAEALWDHQTVNFLKHAALLRAKAGEPLGKRVLDVGCGPASMGIVMDRLGATSYGADIFPPGHGFVDAARIRDSEVGRRLVCADARALPFPDNTFDIVTTIGMLEHIPDRVARRDIIRDALRVLRPDGVALVLFAPNRWFPLDFHYGYLPFVHWLPAKAKEWYIGRCRPFEPSRTAVADFCVGISRSEFLKYLPAGFSATDVWPAMVGLPSSIRDHADPRAMLKKLLGRYAVGVAWVLSRLGLAPVHVYVIARKPMGTARPPT